MDPQITVQLLLTVAKISGTILAIFMAIIIFALRDEDLARLLLQGEPFGFLPLITLVAGCLTLILQIAVSLFTVFRINLGESYDDLNMAIVLIMFSLSLTLVVSTFVVLLLEKRNLLKMRGQTQK